MISDLLMEEDATGDPSKSGGKPHGSPDDMVGVKRGRSDMENTDAAGVRPVPLHNPQPSVNGYGTRMSYASKVLNSILGSHS